MFACWETTAAPLIDAVVNNRPEFTLVRVYRPSEWPPPGRLDDITAKGQVVASGVAPWTVRVTAAGSGSGSRFREGNAHAVRF